MRDMLSWDSRNVLNCSNCAWRGRALQHAHTQLSVFGWEKLQDVITVHTALQIHLMDFSLFSSGVDTSCRALVGVSNIHVAGCCMDLALYLCWYSVLFLFNRCSCCSDKEVPTSGCVLFDFFRMKKTKKTIPSLHFQNIMRTPPWKLLSKHVFCYVGLPQKALLPGNKVQIDWCIGELKLPRHVISPVSVWKLSDHRDISHRWLTVLSSSHITVACQTVQLASLCKTLLFTFLQLL